MTHQAEDQTGETEDRTQETETRTTRIRLGEDGILRTVLMPGAEVTLRDAKVDVGVFRELVGEAQRRPNFVDFRGAKSIDRAARRHYAGPENMKNIAAAALIVDSPLSRALAIFFMGLNKPPIPVRLFTSEDAALRWLKGFVE